LLKNSAGANLNPQARHQLDTILDSSKEMATLIEDLLSFSRMGRAEQRIEKIDLNSVVRETVDQLSQESHGRSIDWQIAPLPEVQGDRSMLRLALINLLSNAVKFTRTRPQARIEIGSLNGKKDEVTVFVKDNGVGFDMRYVDKLFGVFQRLHRASEFEGTGIGLANVRRVVSRHGGRTWAESELDRGATFYFSLPVTEAMQRA
jgi:light-regulated signal transduction histidine kinase (bacteriophytochrome)